MPFERLRDRQEFRPHCDVQSSCLRLAVDYHILRHVVHLHLGWIARAPLFDAKALLGIHVHEDAEFVGKLATRLDELADRACLAVALPPELPAILAQLASYNSWAEYIGVVYGVIKPTLIDGWETHYMSSDPLLDEPTQRLLAYLMRVTSQHISGGMILVDCLHTHPGDDGARMHEATSSIRSKVATLAQPATDFFAGQADCPPPSHLAPITAVRRDASGVTPLLSPDSGGHCDGQIRIVLHSRINDELQWAELLADTAHTLRDEPWVFHQDMARLVWDRIRHARALEKALRHFEASWGDFPVDLAKSRRLLALSPKQRLGAIARSVASGETGDWNNLIASLNGTGKIFPGIIDDYFRSDDTLLIKLCEKWGD